VSNYADKAVISSKVFPRYFQDRDIKSKALELAEESSIDPKDLFDENPGTFKNFIQTWHNGSLLYNFWVLMQVMTSSTFLYRVVHLSLSLAGLLHSPFFFSAHLLDIALQNEVLRSVLQSVTHNGQQLVFTLGFVFSVVYIYTVIAFNFFRPFYVQDNVSACKTMLECYIYHIHSGLRAGGGIGDELESPTGHPLEHYRIVFDITFFFFVIVILLAIVQVS
jgi:ryanodine receptor 2